jgi:hypothetical protein
MNYRLGAKFVRPLTPIEMMVVDVSPCGRFVTMAAKDRSGLVVEHTFVREDPNKPLKPRYSPL